MTHLFTNVPGKMKAEIKAKHSITLLYDTKVLQEIFDEFYK